jgi:hypothetical protein
MCIAVPRPFTDKAFTGIAEYLDKHTMNECRVGNSPSLPF